MRKMWWVLFCVLSTTVACAQSATEAVAAFQDSMTNRQLVVKNFSGEELIRARWNGTQLMLELPRWYTMAALQLTSAKLKGHKLTLQCVRRVVLKDGSNQLRLSPETAKVQIEVDLGTGDVATVLPKISNDLFFDSVDEAVGAVPKSVTGFVPARISELAPRRANATSMTCDCGDKDATCSSALKLGLTQPKVLREKDPSFSNEARHHGLVDSHVRLGFNVNVDGHPEEVWVLRPAGMGLDEEAAKAVLAYLFTPAMCHGAPVKVRLEVDVGFQRY